MITHDRAVVAAAFLLLVSAALGAQGPGSIWPDGQQHIGLDFVVGSPSAAKDVFTEVFPGGSLRYLASRNWEFSLDYAFMGTDYYYPESGSGPWNGPLKWESMPDRFSGMKDSWIFFQTRHFVAVEAWYVAPLDREGLPFAVRIGTGPAITFVVPNEAAKYYPGLSDAYTQFAASYKAFLGFSLRLGVEYRPWNFLRVGLEYQFLVNSLTDFTADIGRDTMGYVNHAGNFIVFVGTRI